MANEIVPFGKYKGRPVEALAADRSYTDWLTAQPWFRDRYQGIYTLIINNFTEPSETPEHNAFQVLFLDDEFCLRCVDCAYGVSREQDEHVLGLEKECREKGLVLIGYFSGEVVSIDDIKSILVVSSEFEKNGADVFLNLAYTVVGPSGETVYCKRSS